MDHSEVLSDYRHGTVIGCLLCNKMIHEISSLLDIPRSHDSCGLNKTMVMEFILLGFGNLQHYKNLVFELFLIVYLITLSGNILIIILITYSPRLHSPMYYFLCNLSACEMIFISIVMPNILYIVWWNGGSMSLYGCISQLYLAPSIGCAECLLLTVMAYDRYLAICNPLRYSSIMNIRTRNHLVVWVWLFGLIVMIIPTATVCKLQFCDSNTIDDLFCDLAPLLQLSSTDTALVEMEAILIAIIKVEAFRKKQQLNHEAEDHVKSLSGSTTAKAHDQSRPSTGSTGFSSSVRGFMWNEQDHGDGVRSSGFWKSPTF
ncbi:olfactory receptor 6F1-like [Pseudophryne corroboree]|uniref:olfactory receptor 6F1-like n=1 Tax=Pseudophryne corroboree TaxID=495146 RepID=UPI003081E6E0